MFGSARTGFGSVRTAGGDDSTGSSGGDSSDLLALGLDWRAFMSRFIQRQCAQLRHATEMTDLLSTVTTNAAIDWEATGTLVASADGPGGIETLDSAVGGLGPGAILQVRPKGTEIWVFDLRRNAWAVAVRGRAPILSIASGQNIAMCSMFNRASSIGANLGACGEVSTTNVVMWINSTSAGAATVIGAPLITTVPISQVAYAGNDRIQIYDGTTIRGYLGNYAKGIAPLLIGELEETGPLNDASSGPAAWISNTGAVTFEDHVDTILGLTELTS